MADKGSTENPPVVGTEASRAMGNINTEEGRAQHDMTDTGDDSPAAKAQSEYVPDANNSLEKALGHNHNQ
ncbi:hypothetical protein RvY_14284 [Ramazzottius varieornatus]|uniref:Uncharacterized protein n=1 Tax=Ramazzottius varieornatus TaxID=947166 RepID=A0A1D1VQT6_RAMVA|nr:hypothetical protein RvY_14284 [Ramazzottius varieornatus]